MFEGLGIIETLIGAGLAGTTAFLGIQKVVQVVRGKKHKIDSKQKDMQDFSSELREYGFTLYADAVDEIVVGDLSGFIGAIRKIRSMFRSAEARNQHFDKIFLGWVPKILGDEDRRMPFVKAFETWKMANPAEAAKIHAMLNPPPVTAETEPPIGK